MIALSAKYNFFFKSITILNKQPFSRKTAALMKDLARINQKVTLKTPVANVKKLQSFLEETSVKKNLTHTINRTANYDEDFNEFLKKFKTKHKEIPNILDVSHYEKDPNFLTKNTQMRKEEIELLEEFRQRKNVMKKTHTNFSVKNEPNYILPIIEYYGPLE